MKLYVLMLLLMPIVFAAPVLIDPAPANNSYTGKGSVTFYINSTSPDVRLFVISEDAYNNEEPWDNYTMSCTDRCSRTISFSIAGSDTLEYFYFEANDSGGTATFTSPTAPLKFRIDRTPPGVTFVQPVNGSYVSGSQNISVTVSDTVSGVNLSLLAYSLGSGWIPFNGTASFDTTQFSNGQSVTVSVNATDNARNSGVTAVSVVADNGAPVISSVYPDSIVVKGIVSFNASVSDAVSGVNTSRVFVAINGSDMYMSCNGACNRTIDTVAYQDGSATAVFHAYDNAGNAASVSVNFSILNNPPPLSVAPKGYTNGNPLVTANLTNPDSIVTGVALNVSKGSNFTSVSMSCNPGFTYCSYQLPSWGEGAYQLAAVAQNILDHVIADSGTLTVDTTIPGLTPSIPDVIKSAYTINTEVEDYNNDRYGVTLTILGNTQSFACVPQSTTLYCSIVYNFGAMNDGRYNATVNATDLAGNSAVYVKEVLVDRNPPELLNLLIEPLNPQLSKGILITALLSDEGSDVASAYTVISTQFGQQTAQLIRDSQYNWSVGFVSSTKGAYNVSINATDENGNSAVFESVGYFFMGQLDNCGDNACNYGENYCLCPSDCGPPACPVGVISCSSGKPVCTGPLRCGDGVCLGGENCNFCPEDCGVCLDSAPTKVTGGNSNTIPVNEVAGAAGGIFQFAGNQTPVFVTVIAIFALVIIVVIVWVKRRKPY